LLHVGMIVTIQLVIYDFVKQLVGLPATGAH
jgi:solute carrier family 25 phosphate transporter 3